MTESTPAQINSYLNSIEDYDLVISKIAAIESLEDKMSFCRYLCLHDLYFLLFYALRRNDMRKQWLLDRCKEIQAKPNFCLDLWARSHYKSTIITFGLTIQDVLREPESTTGIFSHTRPIAKAFLDQIKRELESNAILKQLFPDVLYSDPNKQSPKWSSESGLVVKRKSNPKECTVEAWGVVEGQPISKHFNRIIYDDIVTAESVATPEMLAKTQDRWELSLNLIAEGGIYRYIGTRYAFNDLYKTIMERSIVESRIYTATVDGTYNGEPVLFSKEELEAKRDALGVYTFSCQMLMNPIADDRKKFRQEWLNYYECHHDRLLMLAKKQMNVYILVDPASGKKKTNDYSVFVALGCNIDRSIYLLDIVRDRLNLSERCTTLFELVDKWHPIVVGYEQYGMMADIQYIEEKQNELFFKFNIIPVGGPLSKIDRILRLVPYFQNNRIWLPVKKIVLNSEGKQEDIIKKFIEEEYLQFPSSTHDDILDSISRIFDINYVFPLAEEEQNFVPTYKEYDPITGEPK